MKRINVFTLKQVKESGGLYNLDTTKVNCPRDARDIVQTVLDINSEAVEKFGILTLNMKNMVVGMHVISIGSLNAAIVHPRDVFKAAMMNNAATIVCFHNHPSGDPTPSPEDIQITKRLCEAGEMLGIEVLDHIIVGSGDRYTSLKEAGHV